MTVEASKSPVAVVIRVRGRVDGETAPDLETACLKWVIPGEVNMILDLSGVDYMSSAGLGSILTTGKRMDAQDGRLILCGLQGRLKQIFQFSGFDGLFPMFDDLATATSDCERARC